ncbi:hypothetical protein CSPHI_03960 [Corynebacterium sphenisci DSM 44792]|uniref:Uncharacterized protein n=1 Tax=Corynebacterium sphenisci DSM 44792 TaxID=1437874 RepID=A0A1L7CWY3_9CORY|nr:hypothetical protein [Corynebacterium sphenisci]APT90354.1 hypothetical protein CSPHI_03960 [Corynebacterium sphenisci DSM 44792]
MIISSPAWVAVAHLALIPLAWACLWLVLTVVAAAAGEDPGRGGAGNRPGRGPRRRGGRSRPRGSA